MVEDDDEDGKGVQLVVEDEDEEGVQLVVEDREN